MCAIDLPLYLPGDLNQTTCVFHGKLLSTALSHVITLPAVSFLSFHLISSVIQGRIYDENARNSWPT